MAKCHLSNFNAITKYCCHFQHFNISHKNVLVWL